MSDPKRATFITVGAPKSEKNKVNKTVRLTINLDESNESKYPELNYKELVIAEEKKVKSKPVENGRTEGLNPYSDNDEDVERVARKFEQKYGSNKSSYGKKRRSKQDDFADIGAGYDENDSFIDNTDGYDEMIPPECDTFHGGFYINCGSLEFKQVDNPDYSDGEIQQHPARNKRRISSSSSSSQSDSSSASDSGQENTELVNGDRHEHRKKKNHNLEKKMAKKVRRTDSSAATSGKQTSDDNGHADSGDSRTSQSDSLASKPAPSSENAATSDSSRDIEARSEVKLPPAVDQVLTDMEAAVGRRLTEPGATAADLENTAETFIARLDVALTACGATSRDKDAALSRAARCLRTGTHALRRGDNHNANPPPQPPPPTSSTSATTNNPHKRKAPEDDELDLGRLTEDEREAKILSTLQRLKALVEERKPGMIANYHAECERVQEERKKIQVASALGGAPHTEKRLPKRRFPWCQRSRSLLARLKALAGSHEAAAVLLAKRALPLFPNGFVRMPTLLRQAELSKELKVAELKRQKFGSASLPLPATHINNQPANQSANQSSNMNSFAEPIQFPSSLTVTTTKVSEKPEVSVGTSENDFTYKTGNAAIFGSIMNTFNLNKNLMVEKQDDRKNSVIVEKSKDDPYIPPNNIGSITITPVPGNQNKGEKKPNTSPDLNKQSEPLLRIKSPAALNEMAKKEKERAVESIYKREKDKHRSDKDGLHSVVKDSQVKEAHPLSKEALSQVKESTIQIKHTYVKDTQSQIKDPYSLVKDSNLFKDSHSQVKDSHSQVKDTHSQVKDSHSQVKDYHSKDTRVNDPQSSVKESQSHFKDTLSIVKQSHVKDGQSHSRDTLSQNRESHSQFKDSHVKDPPQGKDSHNKDSHSQVRNPFSHGKDHHSRHKEPSRSKGHSHAKDSHHKDPHHRPKDSQPRIDDNEARIKEILSQVKDLPPHLKITSSLVKDIQSHSKDKERRVHSPLHIETNFQPKQKLPSSPKNKEGISKRLIETMRVAENNIPRPALVPVHHSPTFAKPDKRPVDMKKKKDLLIVPEVDPLSDMQQEPVAIDDSSSDVELVEETKSETSDKVESVPSRDKSKVSDREVNNSNTAHVQSKDSKEDEACENDTTKEDFDSLMKNIRDLEHSQEAAKFNSNSFGGVITSAKRTVPHKSASQGGVARPDARKDKFAERASLNKTDGCSTIHGETTTPTTPSSFS